MTSERHVIYILSKGIIICIYFNDCINIEETSVHKYACVRVFYGACLIIVRVCVHACSLAYVQVCLYT